MSKIDLTNYKTFKNNKTLKKYANDTLYQKRVKDEVGTKYFISIYEYEHDNKLSYTAEVVFNDSPTCWIDISCKDTKQVEELAEKFWIAHGSNYYSKYGED